MPLKPISTPRFLVTLIGLPYGLAVAGCSFLSLGAGHGTDFPLAMSAGPLAPFGPLTMLFGCPVLWMGVFGTLPRLRSKRHRLMGAIGLIAIYLTGLLTALCWNYRWEPGSVGIHAWDAFLAAWLALFIPGQLCLWCTVLRKPPSMVGDRCANCGYSLSGLESRRCPECGAFADRM